MTLLKYADLSDYNSADVDKYIHNEFLLETLRKKRIDKLRLIQEEAIKLGLFMGQNFLICTPSGSGKTLIGEMALINEICDTKSCEDNQKRQGKKASYKGRGIYLVPYRALAAEKYVHFLSHYGKEGIRIEKAMGDEDIEKEKLLASNLLITTFEKLDSILRKEDYSEWYRSINTVVIDEIHVMADPHRGTNLESLIMRLMMNLYNAQMICLSATIDQPENFAGWLGSLSERFSGNSFHLIRSDERPVELQYKIAISTNKDAYIRNKVNECLEEKGQVLIFVSSRRSTVSNAKLVKAIGKRFTNTHSSEIIEETIEKLAKVPGASKDLQMLLKCGVGFHNAGLHSAEKSAVIKLFAQKHLKIICCTTTLAAGINTPARLVILRDFKQFTYRGNEVINDIRAGINDQELHEIPNSQSGYFTPFSRNQTFQLLGRAGRPSMDLVGIGIILTKSKEEEEWVRDYYFTTDPKEPNGNLLPKYNPIKSAFNKITSLREQILLIIHDLKAASIDDLSRFIQNTFFAYNYGESVALERFLRLKNIDVNSLLRLHATDKYIDDYRKRIEDYKIVFDEPFLLHFKITILGRDYLIKFGSTEGISCTCGFSITALKMNKKHKVRNNYDLCKHIIAFLSKIVSAKDKEIIQKLNSIIPFMLKSERIVDYLIEKGFIISDKIKDEKEPEKIQEVFSLTPFGEKTILLYLRPSDMVVLRAMIQSDEIISQSSLLIKSWEFLKYQGRYYDESFRFAIENWVEEESIDTITHLSNKISTGDFFKLKDDIIRVLGYFGSLAVFYDKSEINDFAQTLVLRVNHGCREDILELVHRIKDVGRVRGRKLYNSGLTTVKLLSMTKPEDMSRMAKIPKSTCEIIYKNCNSIIKSNFE